MNLNKFIERNATSDFKSRKLYEQFYSELYFRTTDELKLHKSIIKSQMLTNNAMTITLSLATFVFTIYITLISIYNSTFEDQTAVIILFMLGLFLGVFIIHLVLDYIDSLQKEKNKKIMIMSDAIDKILEEREENK